VVKGKQLISKDKVFYGWFIVAISLVIMTAAYGVYFSWPVFYVSILDEFGWSRAETALIFSVGSIVYTFASPASGILFDKFGPRKLFLFSAIIIALGALGCSQARAVWQFYIFFGVLVAFGACAAGFVPNLALVSNWFEKKRATAVGISQIGTRDSFLLTPLIQLAILTLGWRYSYLVLAAATAIIIIPLSLFLRARPQDMGLLPDGSTTVEDEGQTKQSEADSLIVDKEWASTEWTMLKAAKTHQFWAFFVTHLGSGFAFTALLNHFVALISDIGFTAMFAANLLLIFAVTAIIGRCLGFVSDFIGRELAFTLSMTIMLLPLPILLVAEESSPWLLYVFIICFGFGSGVYSPFKGAAEADVFQGKRLGTIVGSANMGYGLGAAFGTWLYGYIFDVTGTYALAIIITMIAVSIQIPAIWVAAPRKVRRVAGRRLR